MAVRGVLCLMLVLISLSSFEASGRDIDDKIVYGTTEYFYQDYQGDDFYQARQYCFQNGGDLVTLDSEGIHQNISQWVRNAYFGDFWLGMRRDSSGNFKWLRDSSPLTFTNWEEGQDLSDDLFQCAFQRDSSDDWEVANCGGVKRQVLVCEREANQNETEPITTPAPGPLGYCPEGYFGLDGQEKCFQVNIRTAETGVTWNEARDLCRSAPGLQPDLASFHDFKEIALVMTQLPGRPMGLWIGMTERSDRWIWADNSDNSFDNWADNEPKYSEEVVCAELEIEPGPPGTWHSTPCDIRRGFICQISRSGDNIIPTPPTAPPNDCQSGYFSFGQGCYKLHSNTISWSDAEVQCRNEGAFLVTIHSHEENALIQLVASEYDYVWIGMRDSESNRVFYWIDEWPVLYTNWMNGEPSRDHHHDCVRVGEDGQWSVTNCEDFLPFICKTSNEQPPTSPPIVEGRCPDVMPGEQPWVEHGDQCYYPAVGSLFRESWLDALTECKILHPDAFLASMHDIATNTFIRDLALTENRVWIGMHLGSGPNPTYQWIDGSPVQFTNWQAGHPDPNSGPEKACVFLATKKSSTNFQGTWMEEECSSRNSYICAVKKSPPPSIPPPTGGDCPDGWDHYGDRCLYIAPNNVTNWYDATRKCQDMAGPNATLASIEDENINTVIRNALHNHSASVIHRRHWIGGRSRDGMYPTWSDGSKMSFENWEDNEPSIPKDDFACTEIDTFNGFWRMSDCQSVRGFVCSVRKVDIPKDQEDENEDDGRTGLTSGQAIGISYGVILAAGLLASLAVFLVLYKREGNMKEIFARNYLSDVEHPKRIPVNYKSDTDNVNISVA